MGCDMRPPPIERSPCLIARHARSGLITCARARRSPVVSALVRRKELIFAARAQQLREERNLCLAWAVLVSITRHVMANRRMVTRVRPQLTYLSHACPSFRQQQTARAGPQLKE